MAENEKKWDGGDALPESGDSGFNLRKSFSAMTTMEKLKFLLKNEAPVYVVNRLRPAAAISLSVDKRNGKQISITIPNLSVPFCISDHAAISDLIESDDFLKIASNRDHLEIMAPKSAIDILEADPDSKAMMERARRKLSGAKMQQQTEDIQIQAKGASPTILNMVSRYTDKELSANDMLIDLKSTKHTLSLDDLTYVQANVQSSRIHAWVTSELAKNSAKAAEATMGDNLEVEKVPQGNGEVQVVQPGAPARS